MNAAPRPPSSRRGRGRVSTLYAYHGGKARLVDTITALMPPHRNYIEPFFGSGAVFFGKPPAPRHEIVNDVDGNIVNFFRVLRDDMEGLERACALSPHSRDEFAAADLTGEMSDLERARRFWVRVNQSFGKTLSPKTGWSWTTARNTPIPSTVRTRLGRFGDVAARLMSVTIENRPAVDLLRSLDLGPETVVYCDPPYVHDARVQPEGYAHEMTDDDHRDLLVVLREVADGGATVILSGYANEIYDGALSDWHRTTAEVMGFSSNARTHHREVRTEVLWCSTPPAPTLFDMGGLS